MSDADHSKANSVNNLALMPALTVIAIPLRMIRTIQRNRDGNEHRILDHVEKVIVVALLYLL